MAAAWLADTGWVTVGVPSPKSNVTVPVGVPAPGATAVTVAVTVTGSPTAEGSGAEDTAVAVEDCPTDWRSVPVEAVKFVSPL
ncbi:hypothetical protein M271_43550 [Streptomyces rapamycinicus NRRL 5491]|nr:hypothetical protein [Streptomyces rapamycinicus]AGP60080.1 hypothetical protein M271_43550 [Streptomyces rapamycinicus NRRL 5491]